MNWDANQMCIIHTAASAEITLQGMPTNPAENPIVIGQNYNWIVFPLSEETLFTTAFSGFPVVNDDVVISQNGNSATYNGTRWRGSLSTVNLKPGQGYMATSIEVAVVILKGFEYFHQSMFGLGIWNF